MNNSDKLPAAFPVTATFQANLTRQATLYNFVLALNATVDGSCFGKLIPTLQAEGHQVMASQHGLDSLATDVAAVQACLARVSSPAVLVGHSSNDAHKITQPLSQTPQEDDMKRYLAALGAAVPCINLAMAASVALTPLR